MLRRQTGTIVTIASVLGYLGCKHLCMLLPRGPKSELIWLEAKGGGEGRKN
jgi:hypothetical protein